MILFGYSKNLDLKLFKLTIMNILKNKRFSRQDMLKVILFFVLILASSNIFAKKDKPKKDDEPINSEILGGLKFRSLGPAYASGRIADFAVNHKNPS